MKNLKTTIAEMLQEVFGKTSKNKQLKLFVIVASVIFIFLASFIFIFQIRKVEAYFESKTDVVQNPSNMSFLLADFLFREDKFFIDKIEKSNPMVTVQEVERVYPGKLIVKLRNIIPVAYFIQNDQYVLVSENANILGRLSELPKNTGRVEIPKTYITSNLKVGDNMNSKEVLFVMQIAKIIKKNAIPAFTVELIDNNLIVCSLPATDTIIKFSMSQNKDQSLARLSDFLEKLYSSGKSIRMLDLRFEKAIIEEG